MMGLVLAMGCYPTEFEAGSDRTIKPAGVKERMGGVP